MEESNDNIINNSVTTDESAGEIPINNEESVQSTTGPTPCDHQFSMNVSDYQLGAVIGFGSSAIVYMAKYLPLSMDVAVKMIELDHFERNRIDELRKEIQVMAFCKHPNLLGNLTSFVHESKLWIVTPFLAGGSCLDIMKSGFKDGFDEPIIATILLQALQGLEYLHENGHIHRDVKCGNLLMAEDGLVQLADFGVSSSLMEDGERHGVRKTYVGTPCWMAPEVMEITRGYDFKADIWSFGITALELAYGHAPYAKFPPMKVIYLTLSGKPPTLDKKQTSRKYSRMFKDMIDCCLQRDPAKRPTAKTLLKHPFFKSMARKPQYLVSSVLAHVAPVNLRDKSAQLRARGLPIPSTSDENASEAVDGDFANRSFLTNVVTSVGEEHENEDSWDFSIDNSVEPASSGPGVASAYDVIAEEDEDEDSEEGEVIVEPISENNSKITQIVDPLPEARPLEEADASFHGLTKNRTSRFILAAEEDIKEAMERLDLTTTVVSTDYDTNEIVGSISDANAVPSHVSTPNASSSSSEGQMLLTSIMQARSGSPNDPTELAPTEVKKGRFSVLETVNTSDIDPTPEGEILESGNIIMIHNGGSPNSNGPVIYSNEEEKRSRFEVSLNVPVADASDSESTSESSKLAARSAPMYDSNQQNVIYPSVYHNSAPIISGPAFVPYPAPQHPTQAPHPYAMNMPYPTPHPSAHVPYYQPSAMYQAPPSGHHHRPSLTSMPYYHLHSPHPTAHIPTSVPLSPVNPAHLDHLLHVNDYIRNQIVELKYKQEMMHLHNLQQQPQTQTPPVQGMRPHSSFNPRNYTGTNNPTSSNELHPQQLHHSHPNMPPVSTTELVSGYSLEQQSQVCYCCPPPHHHPSSSSNHISMSSSISPAPVDSTTSSSGTNANLSFILKELENIKKENEMLKAYLQQQQQQQQQQQHSTNNA